MMRDSSEKMDEWYEHEGDGYDMDRRETSRMMMRTMVIPHFRTPLKCGIAMVPHEYVP